MFQNRILLSARARSYKAEVKFKALQDGALNPLSGPVVVSMTVYRRWRRGDLDNFQKALLDSLRGVAFFDDDQVCEIHALRLEDPTNPRVEVRVEAARP